MINSFEISSENKLELVLTAIMFFGGYSTSEFIYLLVNKSGQKRFEIIYLLRVNIYIRKLPIRMYSREIFRATKKLCIALGEPHSKIYRNRIRDYEKSKNGLRSNFFAVCFYRHRPETFALAKQDRIKALMGVDDGMEECDLPYLYVGDGLNQRKRMISIRNYIQVIKGKTLIYIIKKESVSVRETIQKFFQRYIYVLSRGGDNVIPVLVVFNQKEKEQAKRFFHDEIKELNLKFNFYTIEEIEQFFTFNVFLKVMLNHDLLSQQGIKDLYAETKNRFQRKQKASIQLSLPVKIAPKVNISFIKHDLCS